MPEQLVLSDAGLARRLKRYFLKQEHTFLAICLPGFEELLRAEIVTLPAVTSTAVISGGVEFTAPLHTMYLANFKLRIANRILLRIDTFMCRSYPELFNKVKRISWEFYLGFAPTISFSVSATISRLHHTDSIQKAVFDGIVETMKGLGQPVSHADNAPLSVFVRLHEDRATISIDTSGDLLYKRGYRTTGSVAPIRETMAAALLTLCDYTHYDCILDPFCGSGTIPIEAAMGLCNKAPGLMRTFAHEHWPSFSESVFNRFKQEITATSHNSTRTLILGSDRTNEALAAARINARDAHVDTCITFAELDCAAITQPSDTIKTGLIITNPPYGKRLSSEGGLKPLYTSFGKHLKKTFPGWRYGIIIAHRDFLKATGLRTEREISFTHGGLDVAFVIGTIS